MMLTGEKLGEAIAAAIQKKIDSGAAKSKAEIARRFGIKPSSINDWEKRGTIAKERLPDLWQYFSDVVEPEHWGLRSYPSEIAIWNDKDDLPPDDTRVWVDRWEYAFSAGNGMVQWEVRQKDALPFRAALFDSIGCKPETCKLVMARGDSMEPFLFDRDMMMIDTTKTAIRDGRIYAIHFEDEPLVKQVFKQAGGALTLHSFNPRYPDRLVGPDDMQSLAVAGEVVYRSGSGFL